MELSVPKPGKSWVNQVRLGGWYEEEVAYSPLCPVPLALTLAQGASPFSTASPLAQSPWPHSSREAHGRVWVGGGPVCSWPEEETQGVAMRGQGTRFWVSVLSLSQRG